MLAILQLSLNSDNLAIDFLIDGKRTEQDLKDLVQDSAVTTPSAWHCREKCRLDYSCSIFSWHKIDDETGQKQNFLKETFPTTTLPFMRRSSTGFIQPISAYLSQFQLYAAGFGVMKTVLDSLSFLRGELCRVLEVSFGLFKPVLTSCSQNCLQITP